MTTIKQIPLKLGLVAFAFVLLPYAVLFGAWGTIPFLRELESWQFSSDWSNGGKAYAWAMTSASIFVDLAFILTACGAAVLLIRRRSPVGLRLFALGVICACAFVIAHMLMIQEIGGISAFTALDALDFPGLALGLWVWRLTAKDVSRHES
jgi:hypothetical protein